MKGRNYRIALIAILSTFSFILYYFEVPLGIIFPSAPFLKMDFSDVPVVVGASLISPLLAMFVAIVKNILHFLLLNKDIGIIGELSNFMTVLGYIIPFFFLKTKTKNKLLITHLAGIVLSTLIMFFFNYFISLEVYQISMDLRLNMVMTIFTPFNLIKGLVISIFSYLIAQKLQNTDIIKNVSQRI